MIQINRNDWSKVLCCKTINQQRRARLRFNKHVSPWIIMNHPIWQSLWDLVIQFEGEGVPQAPERTVMITKWILKTQRFPLVTKWEDHPRYHNHQHSPSPNSVLHSSATWSLMITHYNIQYFQMIIRGKWRNITHCPAWKITQWLSWWAPSFHPIQQIDGRFPHRCPVRGCPRHSENPWGVPVVKSVKFLRVYCCLLILGFSEIKLIYIYINWRKDWRSIMIYLI